MHFTPEDLLLALSHLEPGKALPLKFMPARLWKLIPEQAVNMLLPSMNLEASCLETDWHTVQLHLIPKVRHVKEPKHLRPIALLHPGNKLLASMIARQVQSKVARYLEHVPQWAYLPGRSTHDALMSVCAHMSQVRSLIQAHTNTLPQRFLGTKRPRMLGGISISLDVKKAFDSLSHTFLRDSLVDAEFTQPEVDMILHLHSQACLQVGQPGQTSAVYLGTGVRQGCSLSPLLWALSTGLFYRLYREALQQQNLSEGLANMFADDVFGSWLFRTPGEFRAALGAIGVLVQTLQKVGLTLSQDKTVMLLAAIGTSSTSLLQKVKRVIEQVPHLEIRVGMERMFFKMATSHVYLGAVITYRNFELLNLKNRLQKAWGSFWRLHHLLIIKSGLEHENQSEVMASFCLQCPQILLGFGGQGGATVVAPRRFPHRTFSVDLMGPLRGDCSSLVCGSSPGAPGTGMASHETRLAGIHPPAVEDHIVSNVGCRIEGSIGSHHQGSGKQTAGTGPSGNGGTRSVPYKKWNAAHRALENIPDRTPLTLKEVLTLLNEAIILVTQEGVLVSYHANRRLQQEMAGPTVTFSLVLGLREPKAFRMWSLLETLQSNASLMLVATTLRREKRGRSQLAQSVAQEIRQLSLALASEGPNS